MPRSKKAKVDEPGDRDESGQSEGDESESNISTEVIQADFEAFGPSESDFVGIRSLLQQLFPKSAINLSELAEIISKQTDIGCVHKVANEEDESDAMETDEDIYGLVTVVDVSSDEKECIRQLRALLRKRYNESEKKGKGGAGTNECAVFDPLWKPEQSTRLGWVINERLVNIPFQIAAPSFESLLEELNASDKAYTAFMAILKVHKLGAAGASGADGSSGSGKQGGRAAKKRNKGKLAPEPDMVIYSNAEEELLVEECDGYFDYSVAGEVEGGSLGERRTEDGSYKPYRRVVMFQRAALEKFVTKLKSFSDS